MIVSIANFFYYLFTGITSHFGAFDEIGSLLNTAWKAIQESLFNLGGGGSAVAFDIQPDWFGLVSVVLAFSLLIGLAVCLLKMVWRLFTLR